MLTEPTSHRPPLMLFNRRRLVVQHMDALDLRYEDESFDGIFSCGSIEHFGSLENVAVAAGEMARVLNRAELPLFRQSIALMVPPQTAFSARSSSRPK